LDVAQILEDLPNTMLAKGMIQPAAMAATTVKASHILSLVDVKVNNL
jgi:uncharacterized protein YcgI (DUF1989 family)